MHLEMTLEGMTASYLQTSGRCAFCGFSHPGSLLGQESRTILICVWSLPSLQGRVAPPLLSITVGSRWGLLNQPSPEIF